MLKKILSLFHSKSSPQSGAQTVQAPVPQEAPPEAAEQTAPGVRMVPQEIGPGPRVDYGLCSSGTVAICWCSTETDSEGTPVSRRDPQESTKKFPASGCFQAAGKKYSSLKQLCAVDSGDHMRYTDIYGRRVFCETERFPCFDSHDYLHENRYYRWFFILEDGSLTRIHHTDSRCWIHVTEDVRHVDTSCWDQMRKLSFFQ